MKRVFGAYAYGRGPREGCWWDETCAVPDLPALEDRLSVDVAIIGGGFTGLSAARTLAAAGVSVALLEAEQPGWGASGRSGGFCCLGGSKASDAELDARYGRSQRIEYRRAEKAAVDLVSRFVDEQSLDVECHSNGETELAHRPKDMAALRRHAASVKENYGVEPEIVERDALVEQGMGGGGFHGALTIPIGFGLNPRKLLSGLLAAARSEGAKLFGNTPVLAMEKRNGLYHLTTPKGSVLAGRYMPTQSTVLVTRPLTGEELAAQGWHSSQMCYDTRHLLHYFRLMPDGRFLFGMRGGLLSGPGSERAARNRLRMDFARMFPAWRNVESPHVWSGMVSLARNKLPFAGPVPAEKGLWAAMCYHGNGIAMGCYAGTMVADAVLSRTHDRYPRLLRRPLAAFPLGRARRLLMPPLYAGLRLQDGL